MRFVTAMLNAFRRFKSGTKKSAPGGQSHRIKCPDGSSQPISLILGEGELPPNLPGSQEIRTLAAYLASLVPADSALALVQAKDYTGAHELSGYHEAIQALRDIADNVDAANEEAQAQATQGTSL
ncbi:hypothetical protein SAMN03159494_03574 [Achromobacter sp. NFACC18-2]|nr:hypothetical protein SAMN03159494_03574 [Achromobacter sp. NFACC18-2]